MKQKHIPDFFSLKMLTDAPVLVFLSALFICGAIAGSFTGLFSARTDQTLILDWGAALADAVAQEEALWQAFLNAMASALLWQLVVILCGILRPAALFIAAVCAARGFTLAFSVSALLTVWGGKGAWISLASGGAAAVIGVPCLLVTASAAFLAATDGPKGRNGYFYGLSRYRNGLVICTFLSVAAAGMKVPMTLLLRWWGS